MVTIRVRCPDCGQVAVPARVFRLVTRPDGSGTYTFICPECRLAVTRDATADVVSLLRSGGVDESQITSRPDAPLTEDDLIEFGLALERDGIDGLV